MHEGKHIIAHTHKANISASTYPESCAQSRTPPPLALSPPLVQAQKTEPAPMAQWHISAWISVSVVVYVYVCMCDICTPACSGTTSMHVKCIERRVFAILMRTGRKSHTYTNIDKSMYLETYASVHPQKIIGNHIRPMQIPTQTPRHKTNTH